MRRVVVTGMAGISPIGTDWSDVEEKLRAGQNGVQHMEDWHRFDGLNTFIAAPVNDLVLPDHYTRKVMRSMGRVAQFSVRSAELAIENAGLLGDPILKSGRAGVAYGSSAGCYESIGQFGDMLHRESTDSINANTYTRMMPHTTTVNVGLFFGMTGRILSSSTACTSGSLAIGMAYEAIKHGYQDVMLAGGAEELSMGHSAVFDAMYATSTRNDEPDQVPRPYDKDRDGLVVGEGAATLVLEDLDAARERGATIYAELIGFGTNSDGRHITQPTKETMAVAMQLALQSADIQPSQVGYVNGHGTATDIGDISESHATHEVFGPDMPISSFKSYIGHTLGGCGSLEAWMSIEMLNRGWFAHTANLKNVDPDCASLDYIMGQPRNLDVDIIMSNNFAFGGVNTSLIFKKYRSA